MLSGVRDLFDSGIEDFSIGPGGLRRPGDLAHVLQSGGMDFVGSGCRLEIMEGSDVSAHDKTVLLGTDAEKVSVRESSMNLDHSCGDVVNGLSTFQTDQCRLRGGDHPLSDVVVSRPPDHDAAGAWQLDLDADGRFVDLNDLITEIRTLFFKSVSDGVGEQFVLECGHHVTGWCVHGRHTRLPH